MSSNYLTKIAVVGAGGHAGRFITEALLKKGKHEITAITRFDSQSKLPDGVVAKKVDYSKQETLVEALRGQEVLVITISGHAPIQETEEKLVRAAAEAGVPWILPNEWSPDSANEAIVKDVPIFNSKVATRKLIKELGHSAYIAVVTGFWYEWSLGIAPSYGFDFATRNATFFDDGETKISTSTWPQIGRAIAALLSLPLKAENAYQEASFEHYKNKHVYINSFTVSQRDMLDSVLRVTGAKEEDWTITNEPAQERFEAGVKAIKEGNREGFAKMLYTRIFFRDGCGDFEHSRGTINGLLGLPKEDIDEATKIGIERQKTSGGYF